MGKFRKISAELWPFNRIYVEILFPRLYLEHLLTIEFSSKFVKEFISGRSDETITSKYSVHLY